MQLSPKRGLSESQRNQVQAPERAKAVRFTAPVLPGRSLVEGRPDPTFPPFFRAQLDPVTFRDVSYFDLPRETIEEIYLLFVAKLTLPDSTSMAVLVPRPVRARFEDEPFMYGYTVVEHGDELYTFQRVVFLSVDAIPKGGCDQGTLYEVPLVSMSAWDGSTSEQSQLRAA